MTPLITALMAVLTALPEFFKVVAAALPFFQRKYIDSLQDEIQSLLDHPSPANEQRAAILSARIKREQSQPVGPL